ncbi:hypothetical protein C8034_v002684 [Colletotrichum sidae]|uniref:Secreted protein n=1 Tax=Colletotrichum sidae TaxID=1347389 RepID=A0A4R8TBX1_9PEZI|nr:hypothetical protein C8034_v002684 [Colletotrichum sidae]
MKLALFLASAAVGVHAVDLWKFPIPLHKYCDYGTEGNGGCESVGLNTYCYGSYSYPGYVIHRVVEYEGCRDEPDPTKKNHTCTAAGSRLEGNIYCA